MTEIYRQLASKARLGDSKAIELLISHLRVRFLVVAKRRIGEKDAEDIVQDACIAIAQGVRNGCPLERFDSWAFKVLRNKIGNYLQHRGVVHRSVQYRLQEVESTPSFEPASLVLVKLQLIKCFRHLLATNSLYARVLNLSFQGYTTKEICKRLQIKTGHLYVALQRSRQMLGNCMNDEGLSK